jgi:hypothetical protein
MISNNALSADVIVHGAADTGNFSIDANGKAFKILIDGLYSNKIQAIIRELSSNAYDAQIAADRSDFAFEVQLPNLLDPIFSVRDYGTSLSHEDIMGLYTTVFRSTKENTNLAIGKFGLGSKTPFAYTDSFTVTAFMRGTKRVYGAYLNPQGIPQISLMMSEDTNELDGLMVSFPVNSKDCERFRQEMERVLEGFDVVPNIRGGEVKLKTRGEPFYTGSNFEIFKGVGKARAKQGCVIYPIDTDALGKLTYAQRDILTSNILIDFPIGQLDVTPSRESLSYDDATIQNIVDMADCVSEEITKDYKEKFSKIKTMHEARCFAAEHQHSVIACVKSYIAHLRFNDKPVNVASAMNRDRIRQVYNVAIHYTSAYDFRNKNLKFSEKEYTTKWSVDSDTMFLVEDYTKAKKVKLINARVKNNIGDHDNVVWIRDYGASPEQLRKLKKLLGYPPKFYRLEDFNLPEREKPDPSSYLPRIKHSEVRVVGFGIGDAVLDLKNLTPDTRYIITHNGSLWVDESYDKYVYNHTIHNLFEDKTNIFVVKQKSLNKVKAAGVTNALTEARDELAKGLDFKSFVEKSNLEKEMNHWLKNYAEELSVLEYENDTSFKKVLDFMRRYAKSEDEQTENAKNILLWQQLVPPQVYSEKIAEFTIEVSSDEALKHWVTKIKEDYPLIDKYIISYDDGTFLNNLNNIFNYIKMVDRENEQHA